MRTIRSVFTLFFVHNLVSCAALEDENSGIQPSVECPAQPLEIQTGCDVATCGSGPSNITYSTATISADLGSQWTIVSWAASEIADEDENTTLQYNSVSSNGLAGSTGTQRHKRVPVVHRQVHTPSRRR